MVTPHNTLFPMTPLPKKRQQAPFLGSIRARLLGIIVPFAVALIAIVGVLAWFDARDLYAGRQDELRTVEVASKVLQQQYDEFKKGTISEAEAQLRAKASIRAMRYNADDYLFAIDKDASVVVHGTRPDLEGKDVSKQQTRSGKYFFADMNKIAAEQGQGFIDYEYPKPGAAMDQPSPKLTFVKLFAPWQWTIGTGMYIDDVEATIWSRVLWTSANALAAAPFASRNGRISTPRVMDKLLLCAKHSRDIGTARGRVRRLKTQTEALSGERAASRPRADRLTALDPWISSPGGSQREAPRAGRSSTLPRSRPGARA
jgi:hypothetical protein